MKLKLAIEDTSEDFFSDVSMLGIVAPMRGYQFCWHVNRQLRYDFRIRNDIRLPLLRKDRMYFFNVFEYPEPHRSLTHFMYCNQYDGEFLLPEFKHFDFFWLMKGEEVRTDELKKLVTTVRGIPAVQMATEITGLPMKNKENLIF